MTPRVSPTVTSDDTNHESAQRALLTPALRALGAVMLCFGTFAMHGCLAAAAAGGAGVGYAVGHEQGEDHVRDGEHGDDD